MSSYMLYVFLCIQVHLKNDRNRSLELKEHHIVDPTQQGHIFSERRIIMEVHSPFTIRSDWPFIVYELWTSRARLDFCFKALQRVACGWEPLSPVCLTEKCTKTDNFGGP